MNNIDDLTAWEIRLLLAENGWATNDRFSNLGWGSKTGYSFWISRWDWHGVRVGSKVSFHSSFCLEPVSKMSEDMLNHYWRKLAKTALKAWDDFTDGIPYQAVDGSIVYDPLGTKFFQAKNPGNN